MKSTILILVVLSIVSCKPSSSNVDQLKDDNSEVVSERTNFDIKRGVNISHWLSQSKRRGEERKAYFKEADVKAIAKGGFDHIRLPIDEEQLWDETGNKEAEAFGSLHEALGWAIKYNLKILVDLHISIL